MNELWQDLRYALRTLGKHRGFALVAVATLALGIGANTTMFSVTHSVLLSPLPYPGSDRLVGLFLGSPRENVHGGPVSYPEFLEWKQANSFESVAAIRGFNASMRTASTPERVAVVRVSPSLMEMLRVQPLLGRGFKEEEAEPGQGQVALITAALWKTRFGGSTSVLGQPIVIDDRAYAIVGVLPERNIPNEIIHPPLQCDVWIPLVVAPAENNRGIENLRLIGRLKPNVPLAAAAAEMNTINARSEKLFPDAHTGYTVEVVALKEVIVGDVRPAMLVLGAAVGCILLIACVNIANLLLARTITRGTEFSVRVALGANRWRLARQIVTESLCLSALGGGTALLLSAATLRVLKTTLASFLPRAADIHMDWTALVFAAAITIGAGALFSLAPAVVGSRTSLADSLRQRSRATLSRKATWLLRGLVVAQIALALALLTAAGLMVRSFQKLSAVSPGFEPKNLYVAQIDLAQTRYAKPEKHAHFYHAAVEKVRAAAGVDAAAVISRVPMLGGVQSTGYQTEDHPLAPGEAQNADTRLVTPGAFSTLAIPMERGRDFSEDDRFDTPGVIIINREAARRLWPSQDPVGKRMQIYPEKTWRSVIAVVGDVKLQNLEKVTGPTLYIPFQQNPFAGAARTSFLVVRTKMQPATTAGVLRRELATIDDGQAIGGLRTMSEVVHDSLALRRFSTALTGGFALLALGLAALGVYGVMSFWVSARTRDYGIRAALGARQRQILWAILRQGGALAISGVGIGIGLTLLARRLLQGVLFGLGAFDSTTYVATSAALLLVATVACYWPAARASAVSPSIAFQDE